jgi:16S rRNA (guanine966-N2)-methyltransferase
VAGQRSEIRIIAGRWRSRRLPVLADSGVRPTSDRIRETLFNWLQADIAGSRCLDLFAGSGALGFEALSRGARQTTFVDEDLRVVQQLQNNADVLDTDETDIRWQAAEDFLQQAPAREQRYDIVFLDPPFRDDLLGLCQQWLEERRWLSDTACIYMESDRRRPFPAPLPGWRITHDKQAGQVAYRLLRRAG